MAFSVPDLYLLPYLLFLSLLSLWAYVSHQTIHCQALLRMPADLWSQGEELLFSVEKLAGREEASGGWWILVGGIGHLFSAILLSLEEIRFTINPFTHTFIHSANIY